MDPLLDAIEAIDSREPVDEISYRQAAYRFGVDRTTLSRRYQGETRSNEDMGKAQQLLNPQQEVELVRYIKRCTRRGLPSTREMVHNFGSAIAKWEISQS